MRDVLSVLATAGLAVLAACTPPPVYSQRYAAVVPHAAPPLRSGGPASRGGELALGDSSLAQLRAPREGDEDVGLFIPRSQPRLELRGSNGRYDIGVIGVYGARKGASSVAADQPTPQGGGVVGAGVSVGVAHSVAGSPWSIAVQGELLAYRIPYVVQQTCVANCLPGDTPTVEQDEAMVPAVSFAVVPSYRLGHASLFAGLTFQSHPVIQKGAVEVGYLPGEQEPEGGPMLGIASVGVELEVVNDVRVAAMLYQPLARDPADYGPALSAFVTIPFGRTEPRLVQRRRQATPMQRGTFNPVPPPPYNPSAPAPSGPPGQPGQPVSPY